MELMEIRQKIEKTSENRSRAPQGKFRLKKNLTRSTNISFPIFFYSYYFIYDRRYRTFRIQINDVKRKGLLIS